MFPYIHGVNNTVMSRYGVKYLDTVDNRLAARIAWTEGDELLRDRAG